MKKRLLLIPVFFFVLSALFAMGVYAQGAQYAQAAQGGAQITEGSVQQMDNTVRVLAGDIHRKLIAVRAEKIAVGQFTFRGTLPGLGTYWINQLTNEIANMPQRPYTLLSGGSAGADWTVSGEIVDMTGIIRVYTRLVRSEDRAVEAAFHSDFERSSALVGMLSSGSDSRSGVSLIPDEWEPDSFDNPVTYEIGSDENVPLMNRNLHDGDDEDFFLLVPDRDGRLVMETTGSTDTYMEFYDAETRAMLDEDDDGGSGTNARIRYSVQAGKRYIAKVRGFGEASGNYGFRAYSSPPREVDNIWDNPLSCEIGSNDSAPLMYRTLESDDKDFFLLIPESDGRLVMETTGDVDTYMEFYDAETRKLLDEDDDSGSDYNARIRYNVHAGKRYIAKVRGYGSSDTGRYGLRAYLQVQVRFAPDEYEPDDEPSQAGWIEIGKPQQHTFHTGDDVDWVKFQITRPGQYVIRARGINSNRLDTYIELYDANMNSIDEDDDGGKDLDSLLSLRLESGLYYLKVECLDDEPDQPYIISIEAE